MPEQPRDVTSTMLSVLVVGALILCSLWVFRPFLSATIWAVTIVVTTWPLLLMLQATLWRSRALAVTVTTLVILLVFIAPFWLAASTILSHTIDLTRLIQSAVAFRVPAPPQWVHDLPLAGPWIAASWTKIESFGLVHLEPSISPYASQITRRSIGFIGSFGLLVVQFMLTVVIAAIIHSNGEASSRLVLRFGRRLAGERGQTMVVLAGKSIRAVAIGVMITALAESCVGGFGLWLAGVPLAAVLTAVMFVICLVQIGPGVILIPAVIWMYVFGNAWHATLLLVISVAPILIDNFLRPYLIRKEADLPTLLVLVGVIGGLSAFGLVGIFVGPVVLAVGYTLLESWMAETTTAAGSPVDPRQSSAMDSEP